MDLDLEILDPKDFPKVYDIAKEAFPPSETRPYEEARALLDDPQFNIHVVKSEERKIGGFLVISQHSISWSCLPYVRICAVWASDLPP